MSWFLRCLHFTLFSIFFVSSTQAGVLVLRNSDRIQGELLEVVDGVLRWQSPVAGRIEVPVQEVRFVESQHVFDVTLTSGHQLSGCLIRTDAGKAALHCREGRASLATVSEIESLTPNSPDAKEQYVNAGRISLRMEDLRGNGNEFRVTGDADVSLRYMNTRHRAVGRLENITINDKRTRVRRRAEYNYDYFFRYRWYLSAQAYADFRPLVDGQEQYFLGPSVGHQWSENENESTLTELGFGYNFTYYDQAEDESYPVFRWRGEYRKKLGPGRIELFHKHSIEHSLDTHSVWEIDSIQGLRAPIYGRLQAEISYEYDRSRTTSGDNTRYQATTFGFSYAW